MPAGDLVVSDYQFEIRTTLLGDGSSYPLDHSAPIGGIGNQVKIQDVDLRHGDGSYGGTDRKAARVITIPILIKGTASAVGSAFKTLNDTTWALSTTDIPLYLQLPGIGKFYVNGRPRGVDEDLRWIDVGLIRCLLTFIALDPTVTYV